MRLRRFRIRREIRKAFYLFKGIFEYNVLSKFKILPPREMIINLTYWCNSRCKMCHIWKMKPKNEMKFKEWEKIMKDTIFKNIEVLTISGGEPFLHKDLLKLIESFIDFMPKIYTLGIITNGFLTEVVVKKTEKLIKLCKKKKIHLSVSVSMDGIGEMHEDIRRIPNAFKKTLKTLFALRKLQKKYNNMSLGVGSVILRQNLDYVNKVEKWFEKYKIPVNFQIIGFHETFVNNLRTKKNLNFEVKQKKKLFELLEKFSEVKSWRDFRAYYWRDLLAMYRDKRNRTTPCPFLKDQFALDSFGDVYYCLSEKKIGNVRKNKTMSEVYYDSKNLEKRKKMKNSVCLRCNSGCNVGSTIPKELHKYLWFRLTGKPWYGLREIKNIFKS